MIGYHAGVNSIAETLPSLTTGVHHISTPLAAERTALKEAGRSTESVDWKTALDSDMLHLIRTGQIERARERLQACLSSS